MRRAVALAALGVLCSACAPSLHVSGTTPIVVERLFFGRNVQGTLAVTDSAWGVFLAEVVTPRFPAGFTVWQTAGQWRGANGTIEHEPGYALEVEHAAGAGADSAIVAIIAAYKQRFHQESVMRLVMPARAAF